MTTFSHPFLLVILCIFFGSCASKPQETVPKDVAGPPFQGTVSYALETNDANLTRAEDGSWSVVNDLGVHFRVVVGGYIVQNVQLTTCDPLHEGHQHGRWMRIPGIATAYAGHGGPQDPSAVPIPRYINAASASNASLALQRQADGLYCGVHFLIGRLRGDVAGGDPAPAALQGHSLWLEGTWRLPDSNAELAFRIQATEAFGKRVELFENLETHLDGSFSRVVVNGTIEPSKWFEGVHPQKMDRRAMQRLVLRNIVESIEWTGTPAP
jgi:hypothetical protein